MADDDVLISIPIALPESMTNVERPSAGKLAKGDFRLVRMLPTPLGLRPAIWISPYTTEEVCDRDVGLETVRKAVVLISKGPPFPEIACITIPEHAVQKFPLEPVEW